MSQASPPPAAGPGPCGGLGLFDAVCTMVGIILGSGIFMAPAAVAAVVPQRHLAPLVWLGGGLIALCGAVTYAECAARMPQDGGFFVYYERAFGRRVAQIAGWAAWLITYPASLSAMAWIAASYLGGMLGDTWLSTAQLAALLLVLCGAMVAFGVRFGAWLQRLLTGCKVLAIVVVSLAAVIFGAPSAASPLPANTALLPVTPALVLTAFATCLWTFDGWSDITMLAAEIRRPRRNLGLAALLGVMVPATCYALLQAAVLTLLPASQAMRSQYVLLEALQVHGGQQAAVGLGCLALICAVGALHGVSSAVCRLGWSMASAGEAPAYFAQRHRRYNTPIRALLLPLAMALVYLLGSNFEALLSYFAFTVWIYYAMTAIALLRLRRWQVGGAAAWRAPLGPLAPVVVLATAVGMSGLQAWQHPGRTVAGLGGLGCCVLLHALFVLIGRRSSHRRAAV